MSNHTINPDPGTPTGPPTTVESPTLAAVGKWNVDDVAAHVRLVMKYCAEEDIEGAVQMILTKQFCGESYLSFRNDLERLLTDDVPFVWATLIVEDVEQIWRRDEKVKFVKAKDPIYGAKTFAQAIKATMGVLPEKTTNYDPLADPSHWKALPFPSRYKYCKDNILFSGSKPTLDKHGRFSYMGRTCYSRLRDTFAKTFGQRECAGIQMLGPNWVGKTSIGLAFVLRLLADGQRCCFITDCGMLVEDYVGIIKEGLAVAYADDKAAFEEIVSCKTKEDLEAFVAARSNMTRDARERMIFYCSNWSNLLDSNYPSSKGPEAATRRFELTQRKSWLLRLIDKNYAIFESSGNNATIIDDKRVQSVYFCEGMTDEEAECWWNHHHKDVSADIRKRVTMQTGKLPALMNQAAEHGFCEIAISKEIKEQFTVTEYDQYLNFLLACITSTPVRETFPFHPHCHRYFYVNEKNVGRANIPIVALTAAKIICTEQHRFWPAYFCLLIANFPDCPEIVNFGIEEAVMAKFRGKGLGHQGGESIGGLPASLKSVDDFTGVKLRTGSEYSAVYLRRKWREDGGFAAVRVINHSMRRVGKVEGREIEVIVIHVTVTRYPVYYDNLESDFLTTLIKKVDFSTAVKLTFLYVGPCPVSYHLRDICDTFRALERDMKHILYRRRLMNFGQVDDWLLSTLSKIEFFS